MRLVLGQDLCAVIVHPDLRRNRGRGALAVTGQHDGAPDAERAQRLYRGLCLAAERVRNADNRRQFAADGEIQVGEFRGKRVKRRLLSSGDYGFLILKDKVRAADDDFFPVHRAGDTVRDQIFDLGMHFLVGEPALSGGAHDRVGHGMREMLLQAGGDAQHFGLAASAERNDSRDDRTGVGQRAGFVKHNRIRARDRFQKFAAFDRDMVSACLAHGGQHRQRHSKLERAGEVHHQDGQRARDAARQQEAERAAGERIGDQAVGQAGGSAFRRGFEPFGLLDHGDDLVITAFARMLGDAQHAFALFDDRSGVNGRTRALGDRHGFAGQGCLVNHDLALGDRSVNRDHAAHADRDAVARADLAEWDEGFGIAVLAPNAVHAQRHAAGQVVDRLFVRPLLQQLAQLEQEHDRAGRAEVATGDRDADGKRVEQLNVHAAAQQAAQAAPQERKGNPADPRNLKRGGQE